MDMDMDMDIDMDYTAFYNKAYKIIIRDGEYNGPKVISHSYKKTPTNTKYDDSPLADVLLEWSKINHLTTPEVNPIHYASLRQRLCYEIETGNMNAVIPGCESFFDPFKPIGYRLNHDEAFENNNIKNLARLACIVETVKREIYMPDYNHFNRVYDLTCYGKEYYINEYQNNDECMDYVAGLW